VLNVVGVPARYSTIRLPPDAASNRATLEIGVVDDPLKVKVFENTQAFVPVVCAAVTTARASPFVVCSAVRAVSVRLIAAVSPLRAI